jgi:hypothetical protein
MSEWDRQTTPGGAEGPQWVSAAEAADAAGVTPGTVRYWARNGLIVSEVVEGPAGEKTLVRLDEVLQHARREESTRPGQGAPGPSGEVVTDLPARTSELAPILKSVPELMAQLTAATDRAARAETKVEFLSAQLAEMRRRLAEAEAAAGSRGGEPLTVPESWGKEDDPAAVVAEETAGPGDDSAVGGWPAPPPDALTDLPAADAPEPGPDTIDWGASTSVAEPEDAPEETGPATPAPATGDLSLDEIWNQPAAPRRDLAPAEDPGVGRHVPAPAEDPGVDWHEPAGTPTTDDSPVRPRPANAPVPDADELYGPPRRRWFRRRR